MGVEDLYYKKDSAEIRGITETEPPKNPRNWHNALDTEGTFPDFLF